MLREKKKVVLTETTCQTINNLLQAVEVLTGLPTKLERLDFNTGKGKLFIGGTPKDIVLERFNKIGILFAFVQKIFGEDSELTWYVARFNDDCVKITQHRKPHKRKDGMPMWIVGRSAKDRWKEPYF